MRYIKLFEEISINKRDFPQTGQDLAPRERSIIEMIVGDKYLDNFDIKKDDGYYFTNLHGIFNQFDTYEDFRDYIILRYYMNLRYYMSGDKNTELSNLIKTTKLDLSFDENDLLYFCINHDYIELVEFLLKKVDPSNLDIYPAIQIGDKRMVKILLEDGRMDPSESEVLCTAVQKNNVEIVKMLLDDPRVIADDEALYVAYQYNNPKIFELILKEPTIDPTGDDNSIIDNVFDKIDHYKEIAKLLIKDKRIRKVLTKEEIKEYESKIY